MSWGRDGAIRLWDRDGHRQPGGDAEAHAGGVSGVLALADRLVSWAGDGAIRFWDRDGHPQPAATPTLTRARRGLGGVLALADRLVSWGEDDAIRFWDQDGQPPDLPGFPRHLSNWLRWPTRSCGSAC